jgi:hypothetical protein
MKFIPKSSASALFFASFSVASINRFNNQALNNVAPMQHPVAVLHRIKCAAL